MELSMDISQLLGLAVCEDRTHARQAPHPNKMRLALSSSDDLGRTHTTFSSAPESEPIFSPTDPFVRESTPFAFVGIGLATGDEYDQPVEKRETDFSVDYPMSYEELRDKSPYTFRGFSPNYVLYPNALPQQHADL